MTSTDAAANCCTNTVMRLWQTGAAAVCMLALAPGRLSLRGTLSRSAGVPYSGHLFTRLSGMAVAQRDYTPRIRSTNAMRCCDADGGLAARDI